MSETWPILEFDPCPQAFIEPKMTHAHMALPEFCVLCFFQDSIQRLQAAGRLKVLGNLQCELGANPVYEFTRGDRKLALAHPGVGAPLAAGFLEELIALGGRKFIACGGCGTLEAKLTVGHLTVPASAVRDEGTSYHYLPPGREVAATPAAVAAIEAVLSDQKLPYVVGKTWTTDGFYRETRDRIARRKADGCITVEMEAAAFFAVARFRGVTFGQVLYAGDDLSGHQWDGRKWNTRAETRDGLLQLAIEACLKL